MLGAYVMEHVACGSHLRLLGPVADCSLGPDNGTGVRPGPVPSSTSPGFTPCTQLPLSTRQQLRLRNLMKIPPEQSNGMGGNQTYNLTATS